MGVEVPFLLVGCKSDLRQQGQTLQQVAIILVASSTQAGFDVASST